MNGPRTAVAGKEIRTSDAQSSSSAANLATVSADVAKCRYCSRITLESLSRPGGCRHASNRASLVRSAQKCRLCSLLFRKDRTRHKVPLCLSLERVSTDEDDEVGQVCLVLRHGRGSASQRFEGEEMTFFVYTQSGDPAETYGITAKRELLSTSSDQSFATAVEWLNECKSNHICHKRLPLKEQENDIQPWPSRLIDVCALGGGAQDDVRLVNNDGTLMQHVCLSYVWGTSKAFTTTTETLSSRLTRICYDQLPKTFQDAIIITRRLGERYLWIDSLCILQDQRADWERESAKMGSIYSTALFTIAADSGCDCHSGCFNAGAAGNDPDAGTVSFQLVLGAGDSRSVIYLCDPGKGGQSAGPIEIEASPLAQRGWVCQERILSPRILHYTTTQLFWECRQMLVAEDNLRPWTVWTSQPSSVCGLARNLYGTTTDPVGRANLLGIWYNNVVSQSYSRRKLTLADDKLAAISGLARAFGRHFVTSYLAGLWLLELSWGLSWRRRGTASRADTYRAPSFSWASLDSPVEWPLFSVSQVSQIKVVDFQTVLAGSDGYGRVKASTLVISGNVAAAYIGSRKRINTGNVAVTWQLLDDEKRWLGNAFLDDDERDTRHELQTSDNLQCVHYIVLSRDAQSGESQVLLFCKNEDDSATRIGTAEILGLDNEHRIASKPKLQVLKFI